MYTLIYLQLIKAKKRLFMEWKSKVYQIADVKEWSNANLLELKPDVQRTAVWSKAAQIALIDTIILNIPMPKILP